MTYDPDKLVGVTQRREGWLQLAAQGAELGLWFWDERSQELEWDPKTREAFGAPLHGKVTLKTFIDALHPHDRERVMQHWRHCLENDLPYSIDMRAVRPDGSVRWIDARGKGYYDESGKPICMVGVVFDVTERKRIEQELSEANERLRLAIEAGSVGGWDFNVRTGENVWFGKAHAQLGMSPEENVESAPTFWERVHESDRKGLEHALQRSHETGEEFAEEFRVVWRDGTIRWLRSRGRYYYAEDGEAERMVGISIDITETKQAEQALRESEQRLRLAVQAGRMYVYEWDAAADVVVRSPEHMKILGVPEPLRLSHQEFLDTIHPEDRSKFLAAIAGLTPEDPTGEVGYRVKASDGTLIWLKSNGRGFFDGEGRLLRVIGMVADVTESKRSEDALSDMTRKLIESQEQERARIARELHDDINQRLALLSIELNQLRCNPPEQVRLQELRKKLGRVAEDVQALSYDLHSSKLEYLGVVAGMKSWSKEFGERHKLAVDFTSDVHSVLRPEVGISLIRVLQEALNNANKYSGVKQVHVQLREQSGEIHLIVRDRGKGFDVGAALRGKGLGLTSMRERVRLLNGTISIDSQQSLGTSIHVRIPLEQSDSSERVAV